MLKQWLLPIGMASLRWPWLVLLLALLGAGFSLHYAGTHLGINTDTSEMLSSELPFQKDRIRFNETFPQDRGAILVVVDGSTPEQASRAVDALAEAFRKEHDTIVSVFVPGAGPFFERQGLLYLSLEELEDLETSLAQAQPFIGRLYHNNTLPELLSILGHAVDNDEQELPVDLDPLLSRLREAVEATRQDRYYQLSWQELMLGEKSELATTQRFLLVKPRLDYQQLLPAETTLATVRRIAHRIEASRPGLRIRVSGEVALEHDELESVSQGAAVAGIFSLILVCASLLIGLQSLTLAAATLIVLVMGLIFTAAFATLAVGHLNLISVAFAVLYIGLGVDYAIHFCLRYREILQQGLVRRQALRGSLETMGPPLLLCAFTTSVGFFAFVPTAYSGVSELGIISGTSMFIGLLITFSVLPALLCILPQPAGTKPFLATLPDWIYQFPLRRRRGIRIVSLLCLIAGLALLGRLSFDYDPTNLRDPDTESVATFKELLRSKDASPMTLSVLAASRAAALETAAKLRELPSVEKTVTLMDFVPDQQDEKLTIIDNLNLLLGLYQGDFPPPRATPKDALIAALQEFQKKLEQAGYQRPDDPSGPAIRALGQSLAALLDSLASVPPAHQEQRLKQLQFSLLDTLPDTMNSLIRGLNASAFEDADLPPEIVQRWLNASKGIYRILIMPSQDLGVAAHMKAFVEEVRSLTPDATDLPVIYLESGDAVVKAFIQALAGALVSIILVLLLVLRNLRETLLVLLPLLLAGVLTGTATILLGSPFNFANIIAVPLLFGLGVDNGIHIIHRLRNLATSEQRLLHSSTARAVFFSGLTTLLSFSSLAFTSHRGTASMGLLLAIGIFFAIVCTLVVLPAFATNDQR